jgi:hypothetical protein
MTDNLGDRSLRIWLEILSIGDRNDGVIASWSDSLARSIGFKCHSNATKVRQVWDHALKVKWLTSDKVARITNYSKYHKTRETNKVPSEPSEPYKPSRPVVKKQPVDVVLPDWLEPSVWQSFREFRRDTKHPLTPAAEELAIKRLRTLMEQGNDPTEVINQSIVSGWRGLFPVKSDRTQQNEQKERTLKILRRGL